MWFTSRKGNHSIPKNDGTVKALKAIKELVKMKKIIMLIMLCVFICIGQQGFAEKFSADVITTANGQTITGKYYVNGEKLRSDTNINGMKTSTIVLPDKGYAYTLMHKQKMYMKLPLSKVDPSKLNISPEKFFKSREFIKNETVNGVSAKKYKSVNPVNGEEVYLWMTEDDKWPVKIKIPSINTVMDYKNIEKNFSENVFSIPTGYEAFSMPNLENFLPG